MKTNKLTFVFDEQIFNQDFKDYSIRIGSKDKDGQHIDDVMIYDHTDPDPTVVNMIRAQKGRMYTTPDQKYLVMDLSEGYQVKEIRSDASDVKKQRYHQFGRSMIRYTFKSLRKVFNLTDMLDLDVVNISYKEHETLNTPELIGRVDSLNGEIAKIQGNNFIEFSFLESTSDDEPSKETQLQESAIKDFGNISVAAAKASNTPVKKRSSPPQISKGYVSKPYIDTAAITSETTSLRDVLTAPTMDQIATNLEKSAIAMTSKNNNSRNEARLIAKLRDRYAFSLHQMYSFATVCILFLFIGAPAGAIVKKGGFGYPLLIAIGFYITFVMSSIIGKKLTDSESLSPIAGAWLPCLLLLPFAVYLTWRALHDNRPFFKLIFTKVRNIRRGS